MSEGTELPNQKKKNQNSRGYNTGSGYHEKSGNEKKLKEDYLWRTRKLLETKLFSRNLIKRTRISTALL